MQALILSIIEGLRPRSSIPLDSLARLGEPEPGEAARWISQAAQLPELRARRDSWLAALLLSARPGLGARRLVELAHKLRELDLPPSSSFRPRRWFRSWVQAITWAASCWPTPIASLSWQGIRRFRPTRGCWSRRRWAGTGSVE